MLRCIFFPDPCSPAFILPLVIFFSFYLLVDVVVFAKDHVSADKSSQERVHGSLLAMHSPLDNEQGLVDGGKESQVASMLFGCLEDEACHILEAMHEQWQRVSQRQAIASTRYFFWLCCMSSVERDFFLTLICGRARS